MIISPTVTAFQQLYLLIVITQALVLKMIEVSKSPVRYFLL